LESPNQGAAFADDSGSNAKKNRYCVKRAAQQIPQCIRQELTTDMTDKNHWTEQLQSLE
jgi:hypothetical protein